MTDMSDVSARNTRFQLGLAAIVILITLLATTVVTAYADIQFWPLLAKFVYFPFTVGLVVGWRSRSPAQLFAAPPVAAAIVPLLVVLLFVIGVTPGRATHVHASDLCLYWVIWFPILLVMGAPAALAGSVVGYWFKDPRRASVVRS